MASQTLKQALIEQIRKLLEADMKYFPQKTEGKPYKQMSGKVSDNWKGGLKNVVTDNQDGKRHPKTIQVFKRDRGLHPTQKPVALFTYLIKTYTSEGDLVLDNCMGSGTTGVACLESNRRFIGMELDEKYFNIAKERIGKINQQGTLNKKIKKEKVK